MNERININEILKKILIYFIYIINFRSYLIIRMYSTLDNSYLVIKKKVKFKVLDI